MTSRTLAHAFLGLVIVGFSGTRAFSQSTASSTSRSTADSVFTAEQANSGADVYASACQGCHTAASHSGAPFLIRWQGRSVAELFAYVSTAMPKSDPGSLTPDEYAEVVAYLLKINRMPAGHSGLPADTATLRRIRIDTTRHTR